MSNRKKKADVPPTGNWKGAFADFCMSMMTLFMVMWIVTNGDLQKRKALATFFSDPGQFQAMSSKYNIGSYNSGQIINTDYGGRSRTESVESKIGQNVGRGADLYLQLARRGNALDNVEVVEIPGGLKISLMETEQNPMFKQSEYLLMPFFEDLLLEFTPYLTDSLCEVVIVGHTDRSPYKGKSFLNNWTLSYARANSVREIIDFAGFPGERVSQVAGMGDSDLKDENDPTSSRNRRVELILIDPDYIDQRTNGRVIMSESMMDAWEAAERNQI